jgi:hypothetical protein
MRSREAASRPQGLDRYRAVASMVAATQAISLAET